jgi:hypothetical protein
VLVNAATHSAACSFPSYDVQAADTGASAGLDGGGDRSQGGGSGSGGSGSGGSDSGGNASGGSNQQAGETSVGQAGSSDAGAAGMEPGTALEFSGNQLLRVPKPQAEGDLTLEMWLKTRQIVAGQEFFQGASLFNADQVGLQNDFGAAAVNGYFGFGTGNPDVMAVSTTAITSGEWIHVAATRELKTGTLRVYVNGQLETTLVSGNKRLLTATSTASIGGAYGDSFSNGFVGSIDELRLWNVVRSADQIRDGMHLRVNGDEAGLVGCWHFDDGQGLVAADSSPTHADGVLGDGHPGYEPSWITYSPPLP